MTTTRPTRRRGAVAVAMIVAMMVVDLVIVSLVIGGAREMDLTVKRMDTIAAFYASEAGMNMAVKEMMDDNDNDSDGATGTVSDDSDNGTDPAVGRGFVVVTSAYAAPQTTLTSTGRAGTAQRKMDAILE